MRMSLRVVGERCCADRPRAYVRAGQSSFATILGDIHTGPETHAAAGGSHTTRKQYCAGVTDDGKSLPTRSTYTMQKCFCELLYN